MSTSNCVVSYNNSFWLYAIAQARVLLKVGGGDQIWIFKPQVNFDVIPTYKHGGKIIFRFWDHLNPPHLRWSFRFFGDFRPFQRNFYIFINAGLEPKLFEIKSSTQQQSCKAHKIGQFCHQAKIRQVGYPRKGPSMNIVVLQSSCHWVR